MTQDFRHDDEVNTQRRAHLLGLGYIDTSQPGDKPLFKNLLTIQELHDLRVIPVRMGEHFIEFGVTNTTSQQTMNQLKQRFMDYQVDFGLISDTGFHDYMKLYDPPKEVVYQDITL